MLATYRLMLAAFVALSHISHLSLNLGISSVVCFYFLSGYLMSASFQRFLRHSPTPAMSFYIDRFFRIYPSFLLVFAVSVAWMIIHPSPTHKLHPVGLASEVFLIPENYVNSLFPEWRTAVIPTSWSLGAEMQFYLVVPVVFTLPLAWRIAVTSMFLIGHIVSLQPSFPVSSYFPQCFTESLCRAHVSDVLGYRLPIFVAAVFFLGHIAYSASTSPLARKMFLAAIGGYAVAYSLYFVQIKNPHVAEIFVGIIIMIPLGFMVLSDQDHLANRSDMWVGKLAYPLFLVHYLAISIVDTFAAGHLGSLRVAACVTLSLLLAIPVAFAQELVDRARYRIRGFGNEKPSSH